MIKNLVDEPGGRKLHATRVPTLGGLGIFAGIIFAYTFFSATTGAQYNQYIISAMIVMFFIGLKDDLVDLTPSKKIIGQLVAALIIVLFGDIRMTSLYGILGIYSIPYLVSVVFSVLTILAIINAYNLIDGVDGLAAGIGAIASFTFGLWFYNYNEITLCILSFAVMSSLLAFLVYNFSPANIFMGDTGSLIIGLILAVLTIQFINLSFISPPDAFPFRSSPAMAVAILFIPIFDTLRVFIMRSIKGGSPFRADRNHIHHLLLDFGLSHREVAVIMYGVNMGIILLALFLRNISSLNLLYTICGIAVLLFGGLNILHFIFNRGPQRASERTS